MFTIQTQVVYMITVPTLPINSPLQAKTRISQELALSMIYAMKTLIGMTKMECTHAIAIFAMI